MTWLPLGEAVERSETDEGSGIGNRTVLTEHDADLSEVPSSAPVCALGHLPPGEGWAGGASPSPTRRRKRRIAPRYVV